MSRRESQADALLLRRPRRAAGSVYLLALLLTAALVWACLTPVDVFVRAPGVVRPEGDVIRIVGETGGRILRVEGREGDFVGTGDLLIQLDSALSRARLAALDEQIALREDQLGRLGSRLAAADEIHRTELARLDAEIRSETAALERRRKDHESRMLASGILLERARYDHETTQTLFEEGLASFEAASRSRAEFRLAELEYDRVGLERPDGSEIEILETSRNATAARFTSELEEIRTALYPPEIALSELRLERARSLREQVLNEIRSPARGRLTLFERIHAGEYVGPGEVVGTLEPAGRARVVEAIVANQDVESVRPGQPVRLLLDDSRVMSGTVRSVSPDAALTEAARGSFRVIIAPEDPDLRLGLAMEVRLLTRTDSLLGLLAGRIRESFRAVGS